MPESGSTMRRRGTSSAIALALAFVTFAPLTPVTLATEVAPAREAGEAALAPLPSSFVDESVFSGLTNPTNLEFASDGRVFVTEKGGRVLVFDNLSDTTPTVFADLRTQVHNFWDRGMLGLALDPGFPATPYVYVAYTFDAAIGGTAPRWGIAGQTADGCPTPPGATANGCVVSSRVSRLTASGNVSTGETVLIEDWCQQFPSHSIGDLAFGPDGALYISGGDGADFNVADYGQKGSPLNPCGDPPGGVGGTQTPPTAAGGALRSQDLRTGGDPVTLDGAILRVDPATGAGLSGNPLFGSSDANARRIIADGLRNPFRFTFRPGTDEIWVGDVGWNNWEEVDRITDSTPGSVVNFGWPCYEGTGRQAGYDSLNLDICETLYGQSNAVQPPFLAYSHSLDIAPPDDCPPAAPPASVSSSITGLAFYTGTAFPATYQNALFGSDYSRNCIWVMRAGSNGVPDAATIQGFQPAAPNPIGLQMGPDGALYYVNFLGGIRRIRYTVNLPPTANIAASPLSGPAPLTVSFDSQGSTDPEGHPLTYAWDLDDDGSFDDGTDSTASFTYQTTGQKQARLRVTDPGGEIDTDSVLIQVDNNLPAITIDAPQASLRWSVGDHITFSGTATDAQDGNISSQIDWELILHHCQGAVCHNHAITSFPDTASGAFDAPDHDYPSHLELKATVTDSSGATATTSTSIDPKTVDLTFGTNPTGFGVIVGGANAQATPFTKTVIVGSSNSISVDSPQVTGGGTSYTFSSWSDGGARSHTITAPATAATYTAAFVLTNPSSCPDTLPAVTAAGWQRNGSATVSGAAVQLTSRGRDPGRQRHLHDRPGQRRPARLLHRRHRHRHGRRRDGPAAARPGGRRGRARRERLGPGLRRAGRLRGRPRHVRLGHRRPVGQLRGHRRHRHRVGPPLPLDQHRHPDPPQRRAPPGRGRRRRRSPPGQGRRGPGPRHRGQPAGQRPRRLRRRHRRDHQPPPRERRQGGQRRLRAGAGVPRRRPHERRLRLGDDRHQRHRQRRPDQHRLEQPDPLGGDPPGRALQRRRPGPHARHGHPGRRLRDPGGPLLIDRGGVGVRQPRRDAQHRPGCDQRAPVRGRRRPPPRAVPTRCPR